MAKLKKTLDPATFDKLNDRYSALFYHKAAEEKLSKEVNEEFGEIFDHLLTLLKAKLLEYAHELEIREHQELQDNIDLLNKEMDELE